MKRKSLRLLNLLNKNERYASVDPLNNSGSFFQEVKKCSQNFVEGLHLQIDLTLILT